MWPMTKARKVVQRGVKSEVTEPVGVVQRETLGGGKAEQSKGWHVSRETGERVRIERFNSTLTVVGMAAFRTGFWERAVFR